MKAHCSPERTTRAAQRSRQNNARIFAKAPLPVHTPVHPILQLQQNIGNRAVQRLIQSRTIRAQALQRQPADPDPFLPLVTGPAAGGGHPCDKDHTDEIKKAIEEAAVWRGRVDKWIENHISNIRKRRPSEGDFRKAGPVIASELNLLDEHFKISKVITGELNSSFPRSPDHEGSSRDFVNWARASFWYRRPFLRINFAGLSFECESQCPPGKEGAELAGYVTAPGFGRFVICTNAFDNQSPDAKTAIVLHEAFHASFDDFSDDSYSDKAGYPGPTPLQNADSFATFASIIATGKSFRVIEVPVTITASAE